MEAMAISPVVFTPIFIKLEPPNWIEIKKEDIKSDPEEINSPYPKIIDTEVIELSSDDNDDQSETKFDETNDYGDSDNVNEFQYFCNTKTNLDSEYEACIEKGTNCGNLGKGADGNNRGLFVNRSILTSPNGNQRGNSNINNASVNRSTLVVNNTVVNNAATKVSDAYRVFEHEIKMLHNGYECGYCKYFSTSRNHLIHHIKFAHKEKTGRNSCKKNVKQCPHCPLKSSYLADHINRKHTNLEDIKWHKCEQCVYKSKSEADLRAHILKWHTPLEFRPRIQCTECSDSFVEKRALLRHLLKVHQIDKFKKYHCEFCDYVALKKERLKYHRNIHGMSDGEMKCSKCDFVAKFRNELAKHSKVHMEWFQCHLCPYKTKENGLLTLHLISHKEKKDEKELRYKCDQCTYQTYRPYNLQIHKLNHTKPEDMDMFQCYHCPFKAKRKDNLKVHIFKHEMYKKVLQCFICDFKTKSKFELTKHVDTHSNEQKEAEQLQKTVEKNTKRKRRMAVIKEKSQK